RIPYPLEVDVLGDLATTGIPAAPGVVGLEDLAALGLAQRPLELGLELIIDGIHDVPPDQHDRRPATGEHDAVGVDGEYVEIILDKGPLPAEHRQRLVAILLVILNSFGEQGAGRRTIIFALRVGCPD